ncbi:hypothetical protein QTP88_007374 [Uroleucon formosanum]
MRGLFPELTDCAQHKYRNYCFVMFLLVRAHVCYCYWSRRRRRWIAAVKPKLVSEGTPRARKPVHAPHAYNGGGGESSPSPTPPPPPGRYISTRPPPRHTHVTCPPSLPAGIYPTHPRAIYSRRRTPGVRVAEEVVAYLAPTC